MPARAETLRCNVNSECAALRLSVSNWSTTEADIDRSAAAILRCFERVRGRNE